MREPEVPHAPAGARRAHRRLPRLGRLKNGILLRTAADSGFDAVITTDRAMPTQHNAATLPLPVFVLSPATDQLSALVALAPALLVAMANGADRTFIHVP